MKVFKFAILISLITFSFDLVSCTESDSDYLDAKPDSYEEYNQTEDSDLENSDYNILFVGNSLTYSNDLPSLVKEKAQKIGINLGIKRIAKANYALIDHWDDGLMQKEIKTGLFDYIIVQQGPSSQPYGGQILLEYGQKIKILGNKYGAKLVYFMVWPSREYYHTFDGVIQNHERAATANEAILCPVGKVWKAHFDATNEFDYYGSDGFHPSLKGSTVAADVIVATLFE